MAKPSSDHRHMRVWQNADKLDSLIQKILRTIPRSEFELRRQIDSASDSIGANFVEGYYSGSLKEYIRFSRYSKRSLGELRERVRRLCRKSYLMPTAFDEFDDLAIKTMYLFDRLILSLEQKCVLSSKPSQSSRSSSPSQALSSLLKPSE